MMPNTSSNFYEEVVLYDSSGENILVKLRIPKFQVKPQLCIWNDRYFIVESNKYTEVNGFWRA